MYFFYSEVLSYAKLKQLQYFCFKSNTNTIFFLLLFKSMKTQTSQKPKFKWYSSTVLVTCRNMRNSKAFIFFWEGGIMNKADLRARKGVPAEAQLVKNLTAVAQVAEEVQV